MKLEIPISTFSEVQKAKIISKIGELPRCLNFDIAADKVKTFIELRNSQHKNDFSIDCEKIVISNNLTTDEQWGYEGEKWNRLVSYTPATSIFIDMILSGEIIQGGNADAAMIKIQSILERIEQIKAANIEHTSQEAKKEAEQKRQYEADRPAREAREKIEAEERTKKDAEEKAKKDAETAKLAAEKEAKHQVRLAWAQEHGSDQLRKGLEQGYSCIKVYEQEYALSVLGTDYVWDRDSAVEEKTRSCPSLEALEIAEVLNKDDRIRASVVWLPDGLSALIPDGEWDENTQEGCEAISVDIEGITGRWYKVIA